MTPKPRQIGSAEFVATKTSEQLQRQMLLTQYSILMHRTEVLLQNLKPAKPKTITTNPENTI